MRPAGAIPYLSGLRTLDMLGINDREIALLPVVPGRNIGHERFVDDDYVRWRGVTYMIGSPEIHLEKPTVLGRQVVEVDFGDFFWYFWPLQPEATIRPGKQTAARTGR